MTSSVKPEVYNTSERRQRRTEPQAAWTMVKHGHVVSEISVRTGVRTDTTSCRQQSNKQVHVGSPPAFAAERRRLLPIVILCPRGAQQQTRRRQFQAAPTHRSRSFPYRSLSFSSSGLTAWIPQTFTATSGHTRFYFLLFVSVLHFSVVVSVR